ncbi:MAG: hypothetical protein GWN31_07790 [Candidatus Thorarchaeota archaeon]|nr:hypothetical protein [Candidatus Thorarchaeota archaeon]
MRKFAKKITYFERPGPENTDSVLEAVKERLTDSKIKSVVVASELGSTALKAAEILKELGVKIICVTVYGGYQEALGREWPAVSGAVREKLEGYNVEIIEKTPWIFGCTFDYWISNENAPSGQIHKFLSRLLGFGVKTCVEIALIACEAGAVSSNEEVICIAGTGWLGGGADAAIVIKPCHIYEGDFLKIDKGIEVREIIAMPRVKFDQKLIEEMKKEGLEEAI